jgi:hypothetical protein
MTFKNLIYEALLTTGMKAEKVPEGKRYILLLDIDDTLVTAQNIFIYRKLPTDKKEIALTPEKYAHEKIDNENKKYYNYRDFKNPEKVAQSIITGKPLWRNLRVMDHHIANGWKIGILTARGMGDVIYKALIKWLKFKPEPGKGKDPINYLKGYKEAKQLLKKENVHAINTAGANYPGKTDFEKKSNVIKRYAKQYDMVKLIDDDDKNINSVNNLKLPNVIAIKALSKKVM